MASPTSTASHSSCITVDGDKQPGSRSSASPTSTPPTSLGDEGSILSDAMKMDTLVDMQDDGSALQLQTQAQPTPQPTPASTPNSESKRPSRSSRAKVTTYNLQMLAGTSIHTPTKYLEKHHKNVLHGPIEEVLKAHTGTPPKKKRLSRLAIDDINDPAEAQLATETAQAAQRRRSLRATDLRKEAFRNLAAVGEAASSVAQRGSELIFGGSSKGYHTLRRTKSEGHLAEAGGSLTRGSPKRPRAYKAAESDGEEDEQEDEKEYLEPKTKKWLAQGLYVGQHREFDARLSEAQNRVRIRRAKKGDGALPLPMFAGERMLNGDPRDAIRDFKLPFDTYNPLPRKVKVDGWVKLHKNRFIGEASALWKRDKQDSSQCYCSPEDGCGEACHNRIMSYECDSTNCRLTPEQCGNRPFAQLKKRAKGNGYDYGVEVMETGGKGYGVRAMRTFEPHQIIVEYAGEIITQAECETRMKKVYKKDKCYYLMSFDNKMIIDATRGTIARFVNHSCEPNCEMIKWTVSGEPRMALFAGARGIMTGDELTYDYNFDPFSQKNIQECMCGTRSCRGVLGPKPKHQNLNLASSLIAGTKRKIQEVFSSMKGSASPTNSPKKRKLTSIAASTLTKAKNAVAEKEKQREKIQQSAADHAAQIASRENRAQRRSSSMTLSSRRSKFIRKTDRLPPRISNRPTKVQFRRQVSKPKPDARTGALKAPNKTSRVSYIVKRNIPGNKSKRLPAFATGYPLTPKRRRVFKSDSEDDSPNITPASLRSATRAAASGTTTSTKSSSTKALTQSKLPFKPLNLGSGSKTPDDDDDDDDDDDESMGFPPSDTDPDFEIEVVEKEAPKSRKTAGSVNTTSGRGRGRPKKNDILRKTGAGVRKTYQQNARGKGQAAALSAASGSTARQIANGD